MACASDVAADARSCAGWSSTSRVAALASLDTVAAALAEARAHLLVADREEGSSALPGDRSYAATRARVTRAGVGEASREVRQADALVSMPAVAAGVRDLSVPLPHLDVLARVAAGASPEVASVLRSAAVQAEVVALARTASVPDFTKALARFVAAKDPASFETTHQDCYRERFFSMSVQSHGVFLKGRLDPVAAESMRVALDAMGQHPDQTRTPGQACADALVMLAERVCAGTTSTRHDQHDPDDRHDRHDRRRRQRGRARPGSDPSDPRPDPLRADEPARETRGPRSVWPTVGCPMVRPTGLSGTASRPHISLLVTAETFAQLLAHEQARQAAGPPSGTSRRPVAPGWSPVEPATLEDGTPVPMSELARCLCDADITRIVMSADSQPLDVGRTRRLHTPAQRKAVIARDRGCVWNGCETPAIRCEVHHVLWWNRDNGPTDIEHAALTCRHHHGEIHRANLTLQRLAPAAFAAPINGTARSTVEHTARRRSHAAGSPTTAAPRGSMPRGTRYVFRNPDGVIANAPTRLDGCPHRPLGPAHRPSGRG